MHDIVRVCLCTLPCFLSLYLSTLPLLSIPRYTCTLSLSSFFFSVCVHVCACTSLHRLPKNQDCHEMWSKKRRKSKKESLKAEQQKRSQPGSPSKTSEKAHPPSVVVDRSCSVPVENPTVHHPNSHNSAQHPSDHHPSRTHPTSVQRQQSVPKPSIPLGNKSAINVPLPSAPLATDILESLNKSLSDSSGGEEKGVRGSGNPTLPGNLTGDPDELQKVIDRQRSQIELLSQITRLVSGGSLANVGGENPSSSVLPLRLASRTQTYDYGNQSNKNFEEKALQELELDRGYRDEGWNS